MFDKPKPTLPGTLPISSKKEPEDIFDVVENANVSTQTQTSPDITSSILSAQPPVTPTPESATTPPPAPPLPPTALVDTSVLEEPAPKSGLVFKITVIGLGLIIVILAGLIGYSYFFSSEEPLEELEKIDANIEESVLESPQTEESQPIPEEVSQEEEILPEERDSDSDGITDDQERILKTDPQNHDSDGDELFDSDEVYVYETDPTNPDTDGDTFIDGQEVKNGYNPKGSGKLFEVPK